MQDMQSVENAKKQETLKLSKEDSYGADFSFSSYRDYVDIAEDDLDRPYALFFKVKIYVILKMQESNIGILVIRNRMMRQ